MWAAACGMVGAFRQARTRPEAHAGRCSRGKRDRPGSGVTGGFCGCGEGVCVTVRE